MIPAWKLKREMKLAIPRGVVRIKRRSGGITRARYDLFQRRKLQYFPGNLSVGRNVAIVLIYQPDNLRKSLLYTLKHLIEHDITPIIVANHSFSDEHLDTLRPYCHMAISRPNVGYDFGGYRDGILWISDNVQNIDNLFVLNDSIWFPIRENCDVIETAFDNPADIYTIHYCDGQNYGNPRHTYLQSYFYRFKGNLLKSAEFREIWQNMPLFNDKYCVVMECEFGTTKKFRRANFTFDARIHVNNIVASALSYSHEERVEMFEYYREINLATRIASDAPIDPDKYNDVDYVESKIQSSGHKYCLLYGYPDLVINKLQVPFLKTGRDPYYAFQRDRIRQQGLDKDLLPCVAEEFATWDD